MRLKRVKIFGFKTFADRTEFDIHGNMIAVVGPNGCGKSNLVDAILWGLGEGNARHLRAHTSQDVIFSGSMRRKGVGFAEVSLLFDNEDGSLPIQSSEVSITRRLNRAGESEYFINRQPCRQKDVFDLLADTGLGRTGYSIVGQKEIDQALAASAEDRRIWVDEAAGVQRYRARKVEALKRLSSAQSHLERVSDILGEIESQREPLRAEAEIAMRYKSVLSSLREVESGLLIVEVAKTAREANTLEQRILEASKLANSETEIAEEFEHKSRALSDQLRSLEAELENLRTRRQQMAESLNRADSAIKLGEQKLITLEQLEENLFEEADAAKQRISQAAAELAAAESELKADRGALESVQIEYSGAGAEAALLRECLAKAEAKLASARELHNRNLKQDAERAQVEERAKALQRELDGIRQSLPDVEAALKEAEILCSRAESAVAEQDSLRRNIQDKIGACEKSLSEEAERNRVRLSERATLDGRKRGIEDTIAAHEGLNQGARAVLEGAAKGVLKGTYTPVGEALDVAKEHAVAIETALGAAVNDLIVSTEAEAKDAIQYLKEGRLGRATFQPLPLMRKTPINPDLERLRTQNGVVARASELIDCLPQYKPVFESLLGRTLIVEDVDVALRLARSAGWSRLVTLAGEVVHSSGSLTGGIAGKTAYGLVQRKADLNESLKHISRLDKEIVSSESRSAKLVQEKGALEEELNSRKAEIEKLEQELKSARSWRQQVVSERNETDRSEQKTQKELDALEARRFEPLEAVDLAAAESERDAALNSLAAKNADASNAQARLEEAQRRVNQAEGRVSQARNRLLAAEEHERNRQKKASDLGPERVRTSSEIAAAKQEASTAKAALDKFDTELADLQLRKSQLAGNAESAADSARNARTQAQKCVESAHEFELARARVEAKRTVSLQRLIEEYGITEEDALVREHSIEVPADAATVVGRFRRELKAMGDVNLGAIEAYQRLSERHDELIGQREDIEGGIRQVEGSIRELDKLTRERFVSTFDSLQSAFSEIFAGLFPGGEGVLSLTDPSNILETGVEIDVMLPGKKRQRLELLSGGERSLCAASFLFALLKVKPSPLVILDEVDAPLDGRNVERFIALLQEFMRVSQFILITHNPTTIESAPIWLGVTMQEPGVSTLVPAKFERAEALVLN